MKAGEEHLGFFTAVKQPGVEVENQSRLPIHVRVDYFGYQLGPTFDWADLVSESNLIVAPTALTKFKVTIFPVRLTVWQRLKLLILGGI